MSHIKLVKYLRWITVCPHIVSLIKSNTLLMKSFKWQLIGLQIIWEKVIDNQPARPQLHMSLLTNYPPPPKLLSQWDTLNTIQSSVTICLSSCPYKNIIITSFACNITAKPLTSARNYFEKIAYVYFYIYGSYLLIVSHAIWNKVALNVQ